MSMTCVACGLTVEADTLLALGDLLAEHVCEDDE